MTLNVQNLDRLISHLEGLPEHAFHMKYPAPKGNECGSACCLGGHIGIITGASFFKSIGYLGSEEYINYDKLFCPPGWMNETFENKQYPLSRAIRTLKHMRSEFLRTGQVVVDWDAPEPVALKDWAPPMAREQQLPVKLTALLSTFDRVEVQP